MRIAIRTVLMVSVAMGGGTACATTKAAVPKDRPALDVPPPPPRVIAPMPVESTPDLPLPAPVGEIPPGTPIATPKPRQPRDRETQKPEAKPEEVKPPEAVPPAAAPPTAPVPQLHMPESGDTGLVAGQIREIIIRTRSTLDKIDYRSLSKLRQKAYDDAKLFATQADEALKVNNVGFAKELADKAERLAKELQTR